MRVISWSCHGSEYCFEGSISILQLHESIYMTYRERKRGGEKERQSVCG